MYQGLLKDEQVFSLLLQFDRDIAEEVRREGCPACGGRLHRGDYVRKPRGGPEGLGPEHSIRFSFCCAEDGCRRRVVPPSVRFLGRRVYLGPVMILVQAMQHGVTRARAGRIEQLLGVSARTLRRWRRWWQTTFAASRFWAGARPRLRRPISDFELPHGLLDLFSGEPRSRLIDLLRFLSPITGGSVGLEPVR